MRGSHGGPGGRVLAAALLAPFAAHAASPYGLLVSSYLGAGPAANTANGDGLQSVRDVAADAAGNQVLSWVEPGLWAVLDAGSWTYGLQGYVWSLDTFVNQLLTSFLVEDLGTNYCIITQGPLPAGLLVSLVYRGQTEGAITR